MVINNIQVQTNYPNVWLTEYKPKNTNIKNINKTTKFALS